MPKTKTKKTKPNDSSESEDEISNNDIFKKLEKMERAIEFMSNKFDELKKENEETRKLLKQQEKENKQLKHKIHDIEKTMEKLEWEKLENNIIINGVEKQEKEENTKEAVEKIIKKLKIREANISMKDCYRNDKQESQIIVKLNNKESKINILKARKEIGIIKTIDCGLKGKNNVIYINEQLTTRANKIFYYARQLKKENKIKYAWTRDGKIYIKHHESDEKVRICEEDDLNKFQ